MINPKTFANKMKDVKKEDILSGVQFLRALPAAKKYKKSHKDLWLICEDPFEARDNGYWLFRHIVKNHPEQEVIYAIDRNSPDFDKVSRIGRVVQYGSFKHWVFYLAASRNISSQKGGKPNAAVCYLLEVGGFLKNKRIFLQHGITKDDAKWLYYDQTKFSMFVCGAYPEYEFIKERFGYPEKALQYLGFTRFDTLHEDIHDDKLIVVMPTQRSWFRQKSLNEDGKLEDIGASEYCNRWNSFINSPRLGEILEKHDLHMIFYLHRNMQQFVQHFQSGLDRVEIGRPQDYDVQMLLRKGALLITDFSSVFFDFFYMKKPVLFYQFDEEEYRKRQYQEGYFDYRNNPFSIRKLEESEVLDSIEDYAQKQFRVSEEFLQGHADYFRYFDTQNCERTYQAIKNMD